MGVTFEATRLVFQGGKGCRRHVSEVIVEGCPWSLTQALVALQLGNRIHLRTSTHSTPVPIVRRLCDCGSVTLDISAR